MYWIAYNNQYEVSTITVHVHCYAVHNKSNPKRYKLQSHKSWCMSITILQWTLTHYCIDMLLSVFGTLENRKDPKRL